jgi:tRNA pseudouridine55 synthase
MHGLLVLDKPAGITSRDAVNRAQNWFPRGTKLGHTGTLDPLATGVLVLCVGSATRLAEYVQDLPKTYETTLRLGACSDTDDADGTITPVHSVVPPTAEAICSTLDSFLGQIKQVPPAYSAAKTSGRRAYERARRGEKVTLTPRLVRVDRIEVLGYDFPELRLRIVCGKGTYVRSIARDLGEKLACGGYVEALRRLRVGPFSTGEAVPIDADAPGARARMLPVATAVVHLPRVFVDKASLERLRSGSPIRVPADLAGVACGAEVAAFDAAGDLVALTARDETHQLRPVKVLAP